MSELTPPSTLITIGLSAAPLYLITMGLAMPGWSEVEDSTGSWTEASDASGSWTEITDNSNTWTEV